MIQLALYTTLVFISGLFVGLMINCYILSPYFEKELNKLQKDVEEINEIN